MLWAAMGCEVEDVGAIGDRHIKVAFADDELIAHGAAHRDDLARGRNDAGLADHVEALLEAG